MPFIRELVLYSVAFTTVRSRVAIAFVMVTMLSFAVL